MTERTHPWPAYDDRSHKLLSDNRPLYMLMSEMTKGGKVPTFAEVRKEAERRSGHGRK